MILYCLCLPFTHSIHPSIHSFRTFSDRAILHHRNLPPFSLLLCLFFIAFITSYIICFFTYLLFCLLNKNLRFIRARNFNLFTTVSSGPAWHKQSLMYLLNERINIEAGISGCDLESVPSRSS